MVTKSVQMPDLKNKPFYFLGDTHILNYNEKHLGSTVLTVYSISGSLIRSFSNVYKVIPQICRGEHGYRGQLKGTYYIRHTNGVTSIEVTETGVNISDCQYPLRITNNTITLKDGTKIKRITEHSYSSQNGDKAKEYYQINDGQLTEGNFTQIHDTEIFAHIDIPSEKLLLNIKRNTIILRNVAYVIVISPTELRVFDKDMTLHTVKHSPVDYECVICMEEFSVTNKKVVFVPCGHLNTCSKCATDLTTCHTCEKTISNVVVVYS